MNAPRPLCILIGALGGEGGGVLADWLTRAAEAGGYPAQRTSIPGVAQRTGATTYYLEIFPVRREALGGREVVLALSPVPGDIDLFVASEPLEALRAAQAGLPSAARTTSIVSSHRVFTVIEKSAMGDGRVDHEALLDAVRRFSKRAIVFDMNAAARESGTVISAVMLGAIAGSGVLPLSRSIYEQAIRASGRGIEASLKGFAAGFSSASEPESVAGKSESLAGAQPAEDAQALIDLGYSRLVDYQDRDYANLYRQRVERVRAAENARASRAPFPVTAAVARFLALWMSYEDVIRVADLKSRASRARRLRREVNAAPGDLVRVIEYMKPGIEEWCALLPPRLARGLRRWAERRGRRFSIGLHIKTSSLHGLLLLRLLAGLRWWRPRTSRYAEEQQLIERWLEAVLAALAHTPELALELALCARLIKGYGDTHARGRANFLRIVDTLAVKTEFASDSERARAIRQARGAALADPDGKTLDTTLAAHGIVPRVPKPQPIQWRKPAHRASTR